MNIKKTSQNKAHMMVTIRCTTYNHEPYIRKCLDGFVMQKTNFRFEAIVHDDASTDGTAAIIREYAEKYTDIIKPILETENQYSKRDGTLRRIMNAACEASGSKYIAMCEGDDYWTDPLKLQKQVDFLEGHPEYGLVYTNIDVYLHKKNTFLHNYITSKNLPRSYDFVSHLMNGGYIAPCTWLYRKKYAPSSALKGYVDGTFPQALDIWAVTKIYFLDEVTTVYRVLDESASHSRNLRKQFKFGSGVFRIKKDYIKKYDNLVTEEQKQQIYTKDYSALLPSALAVGDKKFVDEASLFLKGRNDIPLRVKLMLIPYCRGLQSLGLRFLYRLKGKRV